ncbi:MAG: class I SAM-dependent methyltransferase [Planctomycetota bacterium]|nr:class I SAM-dependent methyltransferase [Planctomycetota bacterium]
MSFAPDVCRLCAHAPTKPTCIQRVLGRHDVRYFHCPACDLMQTQPPYWLDEAYDRQGPSLDTGAIQRTQNNSQIVRAIAALLNIKPGEPCLDYGAGPGILVRAMRDAGIDFRWHDRYAQNLFAEGFESCPSDTYRLVTAFEVWEHLPDVATALETFFAPRHDFLLISTFLHRGGHRDKWWYYVPETGQHVAFFSAKTMAHVAERFGYEPIVAQRYTLFRRPGVALAGWRRNLVQRLLSGAKPSENSRLVRPVLALSPRHPSLVWSDHVMLRDRVNDITVAREAA